MILFEMSLPSMEDFTMTNGFDIGKRGITVQMDRPRELIYTLGAMRAMEDLAHRWAKKSEIAIPGGIFSSGMIMGNLGNDSLFSIALWGALRKEEPKMRLEEVDDIYEVYIQNEGDRKELVEILLDAFARAKNPRKYREALELAAIQKEAEAKAKESPGAGSEPPGEAMPN